MNCLLFALLPILAFVMPNVDCSAIPMWEFLSRGEKMNHLFNMFVKQVADHCGKSSTPDCTKTMLVYGLTNLGKMDDQNLDQMDPYQRGASHIIWEHMMKDSPMERERPTTKKSTDDFVDPYDSYTNNENHLGSASSNIEELASPSNYIQGGPMVVRLMPDGSPVPEDLNKPLPKDEDVEEYYSMRAKPIPALGDVEKTKYAYTSYSHGSPSPSGQQYFPVTNRFRYLGY
uniref:Rhythmically expressed gene 5 protein n=1 Tax=Cacopsylla melanoneura TaxID=428564 RepID=A0A8D8PR05_9HEMI